MLARSASLVSRAARRAVSSAAPVACRAAAASFSSSTASSEPTRVTIARGDGIGPEIMDATLKIMEAAAVDLAYDEIEIGENVYLAGHTSGIKPSDWDILRRNSAFLKAPITTPVGKGYKSLNVSIRKTLGLYANVRPTVSLTPYVDGKKGVDVVCVRENEEDTYAGIEHQQTPEVVQCLKLITAPGCERILRYAFDYAVRNGRKRVTVMHKSNIMKQTDGMFRAMAYDLYKAEYDGMFQLDDMIIDIGAAVLADSPESFDVVCTLNLYGDIVSDVIAQVVGSVGLGGSANIGNTVSMFEAIHGSAPDIAGQNVANPSGLLLGAVQMLQHVGQLDKAELIQNAWLKTIEDGVHTGDIYTESTGFSKERATTSRFTEAIIANLGNKPEHLPVASFTAGAGQDALDANPSRGTFKPVERARELHGCDVFTYFKGSPADLGRILQEATKDVPSLKLTMLSNRGTAVWPTFHEETLLVPHYRCRFRAAAGTDMAVDYEAVLDVIGRVARAEDVEVIKTENLYLFDGQPGFSLGQGE